MDSSKVENLSLAINVEQFSPKPVGNHVHGKRVPIMAPYVPPHRRNLRSTNYVAPRQSHLEYSDSKIELSSKTKKDISLTNASSENDLSDLKKNISIHEKQTFKSYNELPKKKLKISSFKNTEENQFAIKCPIDNDDKSGSESSFETYDTASDISSKSIICGKETTVENDIVIKTACNIKTDINNLPVIEMYDKVSNSVKNEKKNDLIIRKILDLANVYLNVTFKAMLSELYSKKYREYIPSTILREINFLVSVNDESSKAKGVKPIDKESFSENKTSFKVVNTKPKLLTAKDIGSRFMVKIYNCKSMTEIWGKIMNPNNVNKLDELLREMKIFYDSEKLVASNIKEGGTYVVFKDNFWHRVRCIKCNEFSAMVLFIDRGDEFTFSFSDIYRLHDKFVLLPAQAIKMSLSDLDIFSDFHKAFIILRDILNERTVYSTMLHYSSENNCWNVQLYLNMYEENINIADLVVEQLFKTFLNPKFNIKTEEMIHVHISLINTKRLFVQLIKSESYSYFMKLLKNVVTKYLNNENFRNELQLSKSKLYLVQNPETKMWYRAKLLKFKNESKVEAFLVDTGANIFINKEDLILLEKLSGILAKYPEQAIEVQVHELSNFYEQETLEHFRKLIESTNTVFASFISKSLENNIPTIRLFKKESDNSFTPLNDDLLLNQKSQTKITVPLKKSELSDDLMKLQLQRMSKMRELLRSLSLISLNTVLDPPQIPKDSCDVHVILADNPYKFVIQLLSSKSNELKKLDSQLSGVCNAYKGPRLTMESIQIGQLYAAKYDEYDFKWYRVYLLEVTDIKSARVYYCDYGYYKEVKIENIVPLEIQFHQLPYQAIWAELYGIKPIFERWTLDDASRFKDLIQLKDFVCIIKSKKSFKPTSHQSLMPITVETVYGLELVDTTTEEDIYIADVLVNERRAVKN